MAGLEQAPGPVGAGPQLVGERLAVGAVQVPQVLGHELLELAPDELPVGVAEQGVDGVVGGDDAAVAVAHHDGLGHGAQRLGRDRVGPSWSVARSQRPSVSRPRHGSSRSVPAPVRPRRFGRSEC